jgi:hypothetical protein
MNPSCFAQMITVHTFSLHRIPWQLAILSSFFQITVTVFLKQGETTYLNSLDNAFSEIIPKESHKKLKK